MSTRPEGTDAVTVTTRVAVDPATAFAVFTGDIDRWWRRGKRFRFVDGDGVLQFADGRLVERASSGASHEIGRVLAWEAGGGGGTGAGNARLAFEFRGRLFGPDEHTVVEVRFDAEAGGTRVTVEHRGWDSLPADHPAKHGYEGVAFTAMIGLFWGDLLLPLQRRVTA
jgi:uncharacterized protein YndB with AHSA1/START domain